MLVYQRVRRVESVCWENPGKPNPAPALSMSMLPYMQAWVSIPCQEILPSTNTCNVFICLVSFSYRNSFFKTLAEHGLIVRHKNNLGLKIRYP